MRLKSFILIIVFSSFALSTDLCDIEGIKGFKFGSSIDETLKNKEVDFLFTYHEMSKAFGVSIDEIKKTE